MSMTQSNPQNMVVKDPSESNNAYDLSECKTSQTITVFGPIALTEPLAQALQLVDTM
jgi:hypothetical protein